MRRHERTIQYFFFGQDFADGLRVTLGIVLPALLLTTLFGQSEAGLTVSLGALCASLTDIPGPVQHKRNGLLACAALVFAVAWLTGLARAHWLGLGAELLVLGFLLSMLLVYGARAGAVGSAGLLALILTMHRDVGTTPPLPHAGLLLAGCLWYTLVCLGFSRIRPYRPAQRALGECIHAVAEFLRLKAEFYDPCTSLDQDFRLLAQQQVVVSEKLDAARELLFKSRLIVGETTGTGRRLVLTLVDAVDLFEQITAAYYDYSALRQRFGSTGVLADVARLVRRMAVELDHLGLAIQANRPHAPGHDRTAELEQLRARIDALDETEPGSHLVLRKILVQLRHLHQRLADMSRYADPDFRVPAPAGPETDVSRFVAHQSLSPRILLANLTLTSTTFRHALRVSLAAVVGFAVAELLVRGHHSYWVVMTTVYMLKPGFGLTKERNLQRVAGTLLGAGLGVAVLLLTSRPAVQLGWLVAFMVVAYSFQRRHYGVMVTFLTAFLLILFHFLGLGYADVVEERVVDTLTGCAIALAAGYLLFPRWEAEQLTAYMRAALHANRQYLYRLAEALAGRPLNPTDYKLARKEVYVSSANLAAGFQRMLSEPKSKQRLEAEVHQFVVLNLTLASHIATLAAAARGGSLPASSAESLRHVRPALLLLSESLQKLGADGPAELPPLPASEDAATATDAARPAGEARLLLEQLEYVHKISGDIRKVTEAVGA